MTTTPPLEQTISDEREVLRKAVKVTEYKYFGYYKMSDDQRDAVDILVAYAQQSLSAPPAQAEASTLPGEVAEAVGQVEAFRVTTCLATVRFFPRQNGHAPFDIGTLLYAAPPTTPAVESGEAPNPNPLTALRAFVAAYKASNEPRSGAMYDAYLCGTIAVRRQS